MKTLPRRPPGEPLYLLSYVLVSDVVCKKECFSKGRTLEWAVLLLSICSEATADLGTDPGTDPGTGAAINTS